MIIYRVGIFHVCKTVNFSLLVSSNSDLLTQDLLTFCIIVREKENMIIKITKSDFNMHSFRFIQEHIFILDKRIKYKIFKLEKKQSSNKSSRSHLFILI